MFGCYNYLFIYLLIDSSSVVSSSNTDRNRILVVVAVMDGHHEDDDLTAALNDVNTGNDVGHWHGSTYHDHDGNEANHKAEPTNTQKKHDHGSQKVYAFYNSEAQRQGVSASRSDAVEFVNILVKKYEEAGLKKQEEEIMLLFLRSDGRLTDPKWLNDVTGALVSPMAPSSTQNNAVSLQVDHPSSKRGETTSLLPSLHIHTGETSISELADGKGKTYPTPIIGGVASAMRLQTYNDLPANDAIFTSAAAADVELSLNLWLCGDGINVLSSKSTAVRVDRNNPHHSSDDMSDEEAARLMAAWMTDEQAKSIYPARSMVNGGVDAKEARKLKAMVEVERDSTSLPKDLMRQCKPFQTFEDRFHLGIGGEKADVNKEAPTLHPVKEVSGTGGNGNPKKVVANDGTDTAKQMPSKPLDPARLEMLQSTEMVDISFVDVAGDHKEHPHKGAVDEDGNWGYIHDEEFLHRNPPEFILPNKEEACAKRDANQRMLTEKVSIDFEADAAAEKRAKESGKPRPKILCVLFTIQKNHDRLEAISHTWGSKCDGIVYASDKTDRVIGTVNIPHEGKEEYNNIWQKNRSIWSYVYDNYYEKYDYFHSGGDDVYLLMENLRLYLESEEIQAASNGGLYLPNGDETMQTPLFLGRRFAQDGDRDRIFNSGGSGYTLNKAALKTLILAMPNCMPHLHTFSEDVLVARCLRKSGILPYDTKDETGAERYMPFQPGHHLTYRPPADVNEDWYALDCVDCKWGLDHCSKQSVAFHYIKPPLMDRMHGILYGYCDA